MSELQRKLLPDQVLHILTDPTVRHCQWTLTQVRVGSCRKEGNHSLPVFLPCSIIQRRVVPIVHHVDLCVGLQQDRHSCRVVVSSKVESGRLGGKRLENDIGGASVHFSLFHIFHEIQVRDENTFQIWETYSKSNDILESFEITERFG